MAVLSKAEFFSVELPTADVETPVGTFRLKKLPISRSVELWDAYSRNQEAVAKDEAKAIDINILMIVFSIVDANNNWMFTADDFENVSQRFTADLIAPLFAKVAELNPTSQNSSDDLKKN